MFRVEKAIKRKNDKLYVKGKAMIILLTIGLIKEISLCEKSYFYEPFTMYHLPFILCSKNTK